MDKFIYPAEARFHDELEKNRRGGNPWQVIRVMEELKNQARAENLWNLFLAAIRARRRSHETRIRSLVRDHGRSHIAPEAFNCSAPDTGNMEAGSLWNPEQQQRWLVRCSPRDASVQAFAMTEPVRRVMPRTSQASSCATGDHYVINGNKWWTSGAADPRCETCIFMGKTNPEAAVIANNP